tara:strand:- start:46113 stop:48026 length:1914 start_codon:yes stop_codon:yes gene_type:complete
MAGIRHLKEVHDKMGEDFLNKLFNEYLIVNEKVNGSFLGFKKDRENDEFKFFNKRNEIGYIDRVLSKFYNDPINHIKNLEKDKIQKIPSNMYFGLEYISNTSSNVEDYGRLPKNGLLLNFIHELDEEGGVIKTIQDKHILDEWANFLEIDGPTIVFEGKLNDDQKVEIMDFIYSPAEELLEKFKTRSFIKYVISILNKDFKESFLENSIVRDINGLVFRFYEGDRENPSSKSFLAKLIDPIFQNKMSTQEVKREENKSQDYTWLIVIDLMNFIEMYDLKTINSWKIVGDSFQERYVKFVNRVFREFIDKYKDKYEGIQLNKPEFLDSDEFDLNMDMINDPYIIDLIKESDTNKEIYKILLNFFRKKRKKVNSNLFDSNLLKQLNIQVDKIKKILLKEKVFEGFFPTFNEYVGESGEFEPMTIQGFSKEKRSIAKPKKVNLLIGDFQPIHLGHIKAAEKLKSKNNFPVVLIAVVKNEKNKNNPFSEASIKKMLNDVEQEYGSFIEKAIILKTGGIEEIIGSLKPSYVPILWGTNKNRLNRYAIQLGYLKKRDVSLDLNKDFKLVEIPKFQSSSEIRNIIKDEKYKEFKRLVPDSVVSNFYNLKKEIDQLNESKKETISEINNKESNISENEKEIKEEQ